MDHDLREAESFQVSSQMSLVASMAKALLSFAVLAQLAVFIHDKAMSFNASWLLAPLMLSVLWLNRLRLEKFASRVFLWGLLAVAIIASHFVDGVRTPVLFLLPLLPMAAAWLVSRREAWGMFLVSALWVAALASAQVYDFLPTTVRPPAYYAVTLLAVMAAAAFIGGQIARSYYRQLQRTKVLNEQLQQHYERLEQLVAERTHELEIAKNTAEAANKAKTLFLGNMSHEFRTPLHQIGGLAQLLNRQPLNDKGRQQLEMMLGAVRRLEIMVQGILELVSLESKTATVSYQPIQLTGLANGLVSMLRPGAEAKGLRLELESDVPDTLLGDSDHLRTIMACYVNNAIRFSEKGVIRLCLRKESEVGDRVTVRIEVHDQGLGIAPESKERIFESFEQADNTHTRKFGGTGVGLSLARGLAALMGGKVGCESELGQGSCFWATVQLKSLPSQQTDHPV